MDSVAIHNPDKAEQKHQMVSIFNVFFFILLFCGY